jgi:hypothetical protein
MMLKALSPDQSILAVFNNAPSTSSSLQRILIKCYDAKVSLGSLKYTLSANSNDSNIQKLKFVSSQYLIATTDNNSIHVFDLRRGVLSQTIKLATHLGKLCDVAANEHGESDEDGDNFLFALVYKDGKTLVVVYDLSNNGKMVKKVKTGSCDEDECMALNATAGSISIRLGKKVKIVDANNGNIIGKIKMKGSDVDGTDDERSPFICSSSDGKCFATNTSQQLHFFLFEHDGNCKSLGTASLANIVDVSIKKDEASSRYIILATDHVTTSVLAIKSSYTKKTKVKPFAYIREEENTQSNDSTILEAFFSNEEDLVMMELTMKGLQNFKVNLVRLAWKNREGNLFPKDENDGDNDSNEEISQSRKKRKVPETSKANANLVLGPGESGGEALTVTDFSAKRAKKDEDSEDDFVLEDVDDDVDGSTTIAQRLALLSSELDRDDDEQDLLVRNTRSQNFAVKSATSDSLVVLLKQALQANDDSQLEVALQVSDKKVIENSIMALSTHVDDDDANQESNGEMIIMLLTKLVTRLSRKPSRAQQLSFWIRTVLVVLISSSNDGSVKMGKAEKDIASRLAPLRSMLSERVESLPALLRLEGRLGLIGKHF